MLLTYAQGWGKGHGCMQGSHGDELGLLGLLRAAHRERWWLCTAGSAISAHAPCEVKLEVQ